MRDGKSQLSVTTAALAIRPTRADMNRAEKKEKEIGTHTHTSERAGARNNEMHEEIISLRIECPHVVRVFFFWLPLVRVNHNRNSLLDAMRRRKTLKDSPFALVVFDTFFCARSA